MNGDVCLVLWNYCFYCVFVVICFDSCWFCLNCLCLLEFASFDCGVVVLACFICRDYLIVTCVWLFCVWLISFVLCCFVNYEFYFVCLWFVYVSWLLVIFVLIVLDYCLYDITSVYGNSIGVLYFIMYVLLLTGNELASGLLGA